MPGNSLSAVASIYFIDLVPIKEHMLEARRVLKPRGLFINFGPLRYMRGDVANMLSGEEILDLYSQAGFDILAHDVVPNTQLASSQVITSVHSNNFACVARKRSTGTGQSPATRARRKSVRGGQSPPLSFAGLWPAHPLYSVLSPGACG